MKRVGIGYLIVLIFLMGVVVFVSGSSDISGAERIESGPLLVETRATANDLLVNGNMEEIPFYWKPPNHFVAGGWLRWWSGDTIPEYDDVRAWRPDRYDGEHAQIYFWYGINYTAGIYQQVTGVQPCTLYQFDMYGRNHSREGAEHNARIGIDPLGRTYNDIDHPGISGFPSDVVWSPAKTYFKVWGLHQVTAEARSNALTAITYVSPEPGYGYYDTFWDAGSLVQTDFPEGRLPEPADWEPTGFITDVVVFAHGEDVHIVWNTDTPASTQVWYNTYPVPVTTTATLSHTVFLPLISHSLIWRNNTTLDYTPRTTHHVVVKGLTEDRMIQFVALSRRLVGDTCYTEVSEIYALDPPQWDAAFLPLVKR